MRRGSGSEYGYKCFFYKAEEGKRVLGRSRGRREVDEGRRRPKGSDDEKDGPKRAGQGWVRGGGRHEAQGMGVRRLGGN